jgi:hypothetical protein
MKRITPVVMVVVVAIVAVASLVLAPRVTAEGPTAAAASLGAVAKDGVVAFYFHGNVRCATCRKIEAYADEAIAQGFAAELASGRLAWRVVNIDDAGNKHFIQDFQLVTRSVVLAEYRNGTAVRWQNLDKVWQLVRDKEGFVSYVQGETKAFLENG